MRRPCHRMICRLLGRTSSRRRPRRSPPWDGDSPRLDGYAIKCSEHRDPAEQARAQNAEETSTNSQVPTEPRVRGRSTAKMMWAGPGRARVPSRPGLTATNPWAPTEICTRMLTSDTRRYSTSASTRVAPRSCVHHAHVASTTRTGRSRANTGMITFVRIYGTSHFVGICGTTSISTTTMRDGRGDWTFERMNVEA